jgi:GH25 family lysozyme M1 (1,4-beta-N-acetylmuramidase)
VAAVVPPRETGLATSPRRSSARRTAFLVLTALALSTTATAAVAQPNPAWPTGVDVSSWQHKNGATINWKAVRAAGNSFAVIKATEGTNYTNPQFAADKAGARAAGLVVGAYHYARPAMPISTAIDQANYFLAAAGNVNTVGQLAPVLDLEQTGGLNPADLTTWTRTFLRTVEARTGRTPILYTFRTFWTNKIANTAAFAKYPLWFALYNSDKSPGALPGGWPSWLIWQYDSGGAVNGITGRVDMNAFCCSPTDLSTSANGTVDQIAARYATEPLLHMSLGAPIRAEGPAGGGRWQPYANGLMFWSVETGTRALFGPIAQKYLAWGGSNSSLGRPLEDISSTTAPQGLQAVFEGGRVYTNPVLGTFVVHGEILKKYLADGGTGSSLGMPISDEYDVAGGRASAFQYGKLIWNAKSNQVTVSHDTATPPAAATTTKAVLP